MTGSFFYLLMEYICLLGRVKIPISVTDTGKAVHVQIQLRNKGILPVFRAKLLLEVENTFDKKRTVTGQNVFRVLPGENQVEFDLILEQPGNYEVHFQKIRIYDMTGFFYTSKKFSSRENIQVMPQIEPIPVVLTHPVKNFFGDSDIYDEERGGYDNSETFQIRPYMAGDKLQSIHWKLSAKAEELMVKESSLPKACPVVLFLSYRPEKKKGNFGLFLELGASLSFSLMDTGCPHYVVWYEEQLRDITRMRVDGEESFYLFLSYYLRNQGGQTSEDIRVLYDEKYRAERYLHSLKLTEKIELFKDGEEIFKIHADMVKQHFGGLEIVL